MTRDDAREALAVVERALVEASLGAPVWISVGERELGFDAYPEGCWRLLLRQGRRVRALVDVERDDAIAAVAEIASLVEAISSNAIERLARLRTATKLLPQPEPPAKHRAA